MDLGQYLQKQGRRKITRITRVTRVTRVREFDSETKKRKPLSIIVFCSLPDIFSHKITAPLEKSIVCSEEIWVRRSP